MEEVVAAVTADEEPRLAALVAQIVVVHRLIDWCGRTACGRGGGVGGGGSDGDCCGGGRGWCDGESTTACGRGGGVGGSGSDDGCGGGKGWCDGGSDGLLDCCGWTAYGRDGGVWFEGKATEYVREIDCAFHDVCVLDARQCLEEHGVHRVLVVVIGIGKSILHRRFKSRQVNAVSLEMRPSGDGSLHRIRLVFLVRLVLATSWRSRAGAASRLFVLRHRA